MVELKNSYGADLVGYITMAETRFEVPNTIEEVRIKLAN